jgi:serine/threonine protein kinase
MNSFSKLMFDVGDTIGERFKVLRVLRGSMGVVYVVRDFKRIEGMESPKIMIAKSLHPELANYPFISRRFEEEAKLWIKIKPHNHILRAYFVNKFHEIFYIFADYIERGLLPNTLSGWIQKKITPPEVAVFILTQIVEGLEFAYQNNVAFHGDLKPANILITPS